METIPGGVTAAQGFLAGGMYCGVRKNKTKPDLAMIGCSVPCTAAAVYTQNLVKGAPVAVTQRHLENGKAQAVICNSGNANTCNADGEEKAVQMAQAAAKALGVAAEDVIVASTGVIGQTLPIEPIVGAVPELAAGLSREGSEAAARAIMTTDTTIKEAAVSVELSGKTVRVGGIAKGSGMIHPNMATMLCFLTTDAAISSGALDSALRYAVKDSFNMVSIDGDTSTNDMCSILASGLAQNPEITGKGSEDWKRFADALREVCVRLARMLAKDGEGATRLLVCQVAGAKDDGAARAIAKSVVCSSLFKAAIFGADANWGRVLCAIGYAGVQTDIYAVSVAFSSVEGRILVCENGAGVSFSEEDAKRILSQDEITVEIGLRDGDAGAVAYGCDLTYDYVKINGDYRT